MTDTVVVNEEVIPVRAYLHRTHPRCVSVDPTAYVNPRKLVAWEDIADHVEWLEKGIAEWREEALRRRSRRQVTGRFDTHEELAAYVWAVWSNTPAKQADIARQCQVSQTTVSNILKKGKP